MSSGNIVPVWSNKTGRAAHPRADNGRHTRAYFLSSRHTFTFHLLFIICTIPDTKGEKREQPSEQVWEFSKLFQLVSSARRWFAGKNKIKITKQSCPISGWNDHWLVFCCTLARWRCGTEGTRQRGFLMGFFLWGKTTVVSSPRNSSTIKWTRRRTRRSVRRRPFGRDCGWPHISLFLRRPKSPKGTGEFERISSFHARPKNVAFYIFFSSSPPSYRRRH